MLSREEEEEICRWCPLSQFLCGYFFVVSLTLLKWVSHSLYTFLIYLLKSFFVSTKKVNEPEQNDDEAVDVTVFLSSSLF